MTRLLAVLLVAGIALAVHSERSEAHPLPKGTSVTIGLHRICNALLICRDVSPKPKINCWWGIRDKHVEIYDPKLDALVTWRCNCPYGEYGQCFWTRVSYRPVPPDWTLPQHKSHVWDWMRRCASLVCVKFRVDHYYRTLSYYPNKL